MLPLPWGQGKGGVGARWLLRGPSACSQPVRKRKKVPSKFPCRGVEFFFPFYSEIGTVLGKWDKCHYSRDRAVGPTQPRGP